MIPSRVLANSRILYCVTAILLFMSLGQAPLWSLEGRWGVICREMLATGDYLHPKLLGESYEDKPLLSYWLMIAAARVLGGLSEWTLRLPSIGAGFLTVWCTVRLGRGLLGRETGVLAGWILTTTFFFLFWARVASSDMLHVAAVTGGIAWYLERRERPDGVSHGVFFLILAVGSLMKGVVAAAMVGLAVLPDLLAGGRWKRHLRWTLVPALAAAAGVYLLPFWLARTTGPSSGLRMVFQENILRYFRAFDHREPWYFYFIYLPVYLLPWVAFLPGWIVDAARRWKDLPAASRWPVWAAGLLFLFLEGSGSKRNYYLLPLLPIVAVGLADFIRSRGEGAPRTRAASWVAGVSAASLFVWFCVLPPYLSTVGGGFVFRRDVRAAAEAAAPWDQWGAVCCDAPPDSAYYLSPTGRSERRFTMDETGELGRYLKAHPRTIVVTYGQNQAALEPLMPDARVVAEKPRIPSWVRAPGPAHIIALVPGSRSP